MPRHYRIVVPGRPHHVMQRGNRRQKVFFYPGDKDVYLRLLKEQTDKHEVQIWAYCLMENHVHVIMVPSSPEGLARSVAETNRRFTCMINDRYSWRGYLWQGRFLSSVMDDTYLLRALRYVENNPVRARIVKRAEDHPWSSARAHVRKTRYCPPVLRRNSLGTGSPSSGRMTPRTSLMISGGAIEPGSLWGRRRSSRTWPGIWADRCKNFRREIGAGPEKCNVSRFFH